MNPNVARILCTIFLFTPACFALPEDKQQVMQLRADSADLNHQTHRGLYSGDVQLDQGSTHIRAAEAITEGNLKNQLIKAIIRGNKEAQAHYWTLTSKDKPAIHAYADTIFYYPQKHVIELIGNAILFLGKYVIASVLNVLSWVFLSFPW